MQQHQHQQLLPSLNRKDEQKKRQNKVLSLRETAASHWNGPQRLQLHLKALFLEPEHEKINKMIDCNDITDKRKSQSGGW